MFYMAGLWIKMGLIVAVQMMPGSHGLASGEGPSDSAGFGVSIWPLDNVTNATQDELSLNESRLFEEQRQKDLYTCALYDFIIEAVFMGLLCVFGFVGNTLSMICLWKDKSKTATPFLLVSLELADTLFLITVLLLRVLSTTVSFTHALPQLMPVFPYLAKYVFPIALITEMGTIYLTLLVTVNRYISVCLPYQASDLCSIANAQKHVIIVSLLSVLYNIPRFFEFQITTVYDEENDVNITRSELSDFGSNTVYQILYCNILYFIVMFGFPLCTLIVLNTMLIRALRKTKKKRSQLLSSSHSDSQNRSEDDITLILIVVVLVFVICQSPALITQLLAVLLPEYEKGCPPTTPYFFYERISDLLVVANSSLNFIIYCFCSRRFRQILVLLVCKKRLDSPEQSQASRHYSKVPNNAISTAPTALPNSIKTSHLSTNNDDADKSNNCETKVSTL